jgi:hypothetical protein
VDHLYRTVEQVRRKVCGRSPRRPISFATDDGHDVARQSLTRDSRCDRVQLVRSVADGRSIAERNIDNLNANIYGVNHVVFEKHAIGKNGAAYLIHTDECSSLRSI